MVGEDHTETSTEAGTDEGGENQGGEAAGTPTGDAGASGANGPAEIEVATAQAITCVGIKVIRADGQVEEITPRSTVVERG